MLQKPRRITVLLAAAISAITVSACKPAPTLKSNGGMSYVWRVASTDAFGRPVQVTEEELDATASALESRIRRELLQPAATVERVDGDRLALRIIVPGLKQEQADGIAANIAMHGDLQLAIVADREHHRKLAELVETEGSATDPKIRYVGKMGEPHGVWAEVGATDELQPKHRVNLHLLPEPIVRDGKTGEVLDGSALTAAIDELPLRSLQVLLAIDPSRSIDQNKLNSARADVDSNGSPSISFELNAQGAAAMGVLTTVHTKSISDGKFHHMAIVLDGVVLSAPRLTSVISDRGQITGQFTQQEVERVVSVLRTGRLPLRLESQPISAEYHEPGGE